MDLANLRAGLKAALDTIPGLTGYAYWPLTCEVALPAAMAVPSRNNLHADFDNDTSVAFEIHLLAAWASDGFAVGQTALDAYLDSAGSQAVAVALEADPTLGGTCESVLVTRWRDYHFQHRINPNGPPAWGVVFDVEILTE